MKYGDLADVDVKVGEPWFILRAQDVLAPASVAAYANTLRAAAAGFEYGDTVLTGDDRRIIDGLREQALQCDSIAAAMISWQVEHGAKLPD